MGDPVYTETEDREDQEKPRDVQERGKRLTAPLHRQFQCQQFLEE